MPYAPAEVERSTKNVAGHEGRYKCELRFDN